MSNWTKRQSAGVVRSFVIAFVIVILIVILYTLGILDAWVGGVSLGIAMFLNLDFWSFFFAMLLVIGIITFLVRSRFNWGGA